MSVTAALPCPKKVKSCIPSFTLSMAFCFKYGSEMPTEDFVYVTAFPPNGGDSTTPAALSNLLLI